MEVHHPHHPTHKKKWSEYLLEFFMLFLAVTLGFFAENFRENLSDREKEKAIIISLKEDLIKDTAQLHYLINEYPNKIESWNDSLHSIINNKPTKGNEGLILQAIINCTVLQYYSAGEVANSITTSTESMNLIKNNKIKKQLLEYKKNEKYYTEYLKFTVNTFQQTDTAILSFTDLKTFKQFNGKATLNDLYITSNNIPKNINFQSYNKAIFQSHIRNIDHADLKVYDLKTNYSMLLFNEKEILNTINEEYLKIK